MSNLIQILISPDPNAPMISVEAVSAVEGKGLVGDRYYEGKGTFSPHPQKPDFEVTLIESECVQEFASKSGLPFTVFHARRNLVTEGVRLNALVGVTFGVGEVELLGMRLCEPCNYLAKISWPEALKGLVHQGGLRARIVKSGTVRVGDRILVRSVG